MLTPSTPSRCALTAWRTLVHLCRTLIPAARNAGRCSAGLNPAVSTTGTPDSMIAARYSAYGGGLIDGRMVRFTPNGLSVRSRHRLISVTRSSGDGWVNAVMKPSAPAFRSEEHTSELQ